MGMTLEKDIGVWQGASAVIVLPFSIRVDGYASKGQYDHRLDPSIGDTVHRLLVTVRTYPTLSRKYGELVCTAGLTEDGNWMRIYPVPFRRLADYKQFQKYSVIEMDVTSQ